MPQFYAVGVTPRRPASEFDDGKDVDDDIGNLDQADAHDRNTRGAHGTHGLAGTHVTASAPRAAAVRRR